MRFWCKLAALVSVASVGLLGQSMSAGKRAAASGKTAENPARQLPTAQNVDPGGPSGGGDGSTFP